MDAECVSIFTAGAHYRQYIATYIYWNVLSGWFQVRTVAYISTSGDDLNRIVEFLVSFR